MNPSHRVIATFVAFWMGSIVSAGIMPLGPYHFRCAGIATATDGSPSSYDWNGTADDSPESIDSYPYHIGYSIVGDATGYCAESNANLDHVEYRPGVAQNPSDPFSRYGSIVAHSHAIFSAARNFGAHAISSIYVSLEFAIDTSSQYWIDQASPLGFAKIFSSDGSLLVGGEGKVSTSGLLSAGRYRIDCLVSTEAWGEHRDAWIRDSQYMSFTIPSPGPIALGTSALALLSVPRRRCNH